MKQVNKKKIIEKRKVIFMENEELKKISEIDQRKKVPNRLDYLRDSYSHPGTRKVLTKTQREAEIKKTKK